MPDYGTELGLTRVVKWDSKKGRNTSTVASALGYIRNIRE